MRILFTSIVLLCMAAFANAQSGSARMVNWTFTSKKIGDNTYELRMKAVLNGRYHIYAQDVGVEGPVGTSFSFSTNPIVSLEGQVKEVGKLIQKHEEVWEGKVNYYEREVEFVQVIKLKRDIKTAVSGKVEFMVCDDKECLPPSEVPFRIALES